MRHDAGKQMEITELFNKRDHVRNICTAPKMIEIRQYVLLACLLINIFATDRLAIELYRKLLSVNLWILKVFQVSSKTFTIDKN